MPRMTKGDPIFPSKVLPLNAFEIEVTNLAPPLVDNDGDGLADGYIVNGTPTSVIVDNGIQTIYFGSITYSYNAGSTIGFFRPDTIAFPAQHYAFVSVCGNIVGINDTDAVGYLKTVISWRANYGSGGGTADGSFVNENYSVSRNVVGNIGKFQRMYIVRFGVWGNFAPSFEWQPSSTSSNTFNNLYIYWREPIWVNLSTLPELPSKIKEHYGIDDWIGFDAITLSKIFQKSWVGTKTIRIWHADGVIIGGEVVE